MNDLFAFICFFYVSRFLALNIYSFIKKENKTKMKMANLGSGKLQLALTFLYSVYSLIQRKYAPPLILILAFLLCFHLIVLWPHHSFSQLALHSLHFWWEGNWLVFLSLKCPLLTICKEKVLESDSVRDVAQYESCIFILVWLGLCHLSYASVNGRGQLLRERTARFNTDTPLLCSGKTIKKGSQDQGQTTKTHFSIYG